MEVPSHALASSPLTLYTRTTQAAVIYPSGRHRPPVVIISICGDDKVTPGFVSTERPRGGLPSQIKESLHFRGDNGEELPYEYDHGTPGLLRPSISPRRAPRRQITPWISPLNLNFSGCIKRWSQQRGGRGRGGAGGSWGKGRGFLGSGRRSHFSLRAPSAPT